MQCYVGKIIYDIDFFLCGNKMYGMKIFGLRKTKMNGKIVLAHNFGNEKEREIVCNALTLDTV